MPPHARARQRPIICSDALKHLFSLSRIHPPDWEVRAFCMALYGAVSQPGADGEVPDMGTRMPVIVCVCVLLLCACLRTSMFCVW